MTPLLDPPVCGSFTYLFLTTSDLKDDPRIFISAYERITAATQIKPDEARFLEKKDCQKVEELLRILENFHLSAYKNDRSRLIKSRIPYSLFRRISLPDVALSLSGIPAADAILLCSELEAGAWVDPGKVERKLKSKESFSERKCDSMWFHFVVSRHGGDFLSTGYHWE